MRKFCLADLAQLESHRSSRVAYLPVVSRTVVRTSRELVDAGLQN